MTGFSPGLFRAVLHHSTVYCSILWHEKAILYNTTCIAGGEGGGGFRTKFAYLRGISWIFKCSLNFRNHPLWKLLKEVPIDTVHTCSTCRYALVNCKLTILRFLLKYSPKFPPLTHWLTLSLSLSLYLSLSLSHYLSLSHSLSLLIVSLSLSSRFV